MFPSREAQYPSTCTLVEYTKCVFGTAPVFSVPVLMYRSYRSVRYQYWCRTELTKVSSTGIDVPNLPKCSAPVIPPVYTAGMIRYVPYQTHPSLYAVQKVPVGLSTETKSEQKNARAPLNFWWKKNNLHFLGWFLLCVSDSDLASLVRSQKQISFVQIEQAACAKRTRRWYSGH